jgi:transcriptional regulator with XRE-family HTH domain
VPVTYDTPWIGQRIRYFRLLRGWSGRALARRARIPHTYLQTIEAGASPTLPLVTFLRIVQALDITVAEFFGALSGASLCEEAFPPCPACEAVASLADATASMQHRLPVLL